MTSPRQTEAAGGVLWRRARQRPESGEGVEVALVHRPRYDDWSLPKGKLEPGEPPLLAALREVDEETGFRGRPGRFLTETRYTVDGRDKRVRYWALEAVDGAFTPNDEVDEVCWVPPGEAAAMLATDHDRPVLAAFTADVAQTWPVLVLRHASAGVRARWTGDDTGRPLDDRGLAQAEALVPVLGAYGLTRVLSSDAVRCLDTVAPFARTHRLTVESEPLVSEAGFAGHPDAARARLVDLVREGGPLVVCSHGGVLDELVTHVCDVLGHAPPPDGPARKGGMWVLHCAAVDPGGADGLPRLAGVERHDAPG